jgi:hypothetical protein
MTTRVTDPQLQNGGEVYMPCSTADLLVGVQTLVRVIEATALKFQGGLCTMMTCISELVRLCKLLLE